MRRIILLLLLSQCTTTTNYQPISHPVIERTGYTLAYDGRLRNPAWVYEELTAGSIQGTAERADFAFLEDPLLPPPMQSTLSDYKGSGFDRGHLRPAANAHSSPLAMQETFLSNISPQHPLLNRKYWLKLEKYVRNLTKEFDILYVVTGPLFLPTQESDGKKYVKYRVIGPHNVAVPTHFFKAIRCLKGAASRFEAYILPNEPISPDTPLTAFSATKEAVEHAAGIVLK